MTFNEPEERLHAPQVQLPYQLPDDVVDGEDREVTLKPLPPPEEESFSPRALTSLGGPRSPTSSSRPPRLPR